MNTKKYKRHNINYKVQLFFQSHATKYITVLNIYITSIISNILMNIIKTHTLNSDVYSLYLYNLGNQQHKHCHTVRQCDIFKLKMYHSMNQILENIHTFYTFL